jgi:tetratricopeptide (TPR) repeat protein
MSLVRQHREAEAESVLRKDLETRPDDLDARAMLVRVLAFEGRSRDAEAEAGEIAKRSTEGDPRAWIEIGHAKEIAHDFEGALAAYDQAAAAAPNDPAGPLEGGIRAARWGEVEEAAPRLEEAVRRGAHDAETWHTLGLVRVHLRDLDGAQTAYREGILADPRSAECWLGVATVAVLREDPALALQAYDAIARLQPRFASAQLGRAWALAKAGRKEEARGAIDRAEELGASPAAVAKQRAMLDAK